MAHWSEGDWGKDLKEPHQPIPSFRIDPRRSALLIVDVQNRTVYPEVGNGGWQDVPRELWPMGYFKRAQDILIPNLKILLGAFRQQRLRVIYLTVGPNLPDGSDYVKQAEMACSSSVAPTSAHFPVGTLDWSLEPCNRSAYR